MYKALNRLEKKSKITKKKKKKHEIRLKSWFNFATIWKKFKKYKDNK